MVVILVVYLEVDVSQTYTAEPILHILSWPHKIPRHV